MIPWFQNAIENRLRVFIHLFFQFSQNGVNKRNSLGMAILWLLFLNYCYSHDRMSHGSKVHFELAVWNFLYLVVSETEKCSINFFINWFFGLLASFSWNYPDWPKFGPKKSLEVSFLISWKVLELRFPFPTMQICQQRCCSAL